MGPGLSRRHGARAVANRGGQPGHPGSGPELLPNERVDEVMVHHPDACRRCGTLLEGEDPDNSGVSTRQFLSSKHEGCSSQAVYAQYAAVKGSAEPKFEMSCSATRTGARKNRQ